MIKLQQAIIKYHTQHTELVKLKSQLSILMVEELIEKYGSMRKAAKAVGESPSNFCTVSSGKRTISWDKLLEYSSHLS